jgi:hypothetical protein
MLLGNDPGPMSLWRFRAKWRPVPLKKTRQNKKLDPGRRRPFLLTDLQRSTAQTKSLNEEQTSTGHFVHRNFSYDATLLPHHSEAGAAISLFAQPKPFSESEQDPPSPETLQEFCASTRNN